MPVFTASVPGVLKVGDRIEIGGKIRENARKMSVNLCAQEGEEPRDVVLHFDVRFHRDNIISLSRKNGVWIGSCNYDTNYNMFVRGTMFRIVFEVKDTDVITIYCQGKFHSNFLPKIPLTMAKFLVAWADVERVTHCYFHMGIKPPRCAGDEKQPPLTPRRSPHRSCRSTVATAIPQDYRRTRRKTSAPPADSSNASSDENKRRPKAEGRANRFFYDSLMCPTPDRQNRVGSPGAMKSRRDPSDTRRDGSCSPMQPEHSRKYTSRPEDSDTEKNNSDAYTDETVVSKDSTIVDSYSPHLSIKKFNRRGSRNPFTQVASLMGKTTRKNV